MGTDPREVTVTVEVARSGKEGTVTLQCSSLAETCWGSLDSHSARVHTTIGKAAPCPGRLALGQWSVNDETCPPGGAIRKLHFK